MPWGDLVIGVLGNLIAWAIIGAILTPIVVRMRRDWRTAMRSLAGQADGLARTEILLRQMIEDEHTSEQQRAQARRWLGQLEDARRWSTRPPG